LTNSLRQLLLTGLTIPLLVGLGRNLAFHQELRELATLRLTLEWHLRSASYRSPLSPWPLLTLVFAFVRRSDASDLPASSDSLNRPLLPRLTYRLSLPVLIS
jgi:hypothetical protein